MPETKELPLVKRTTPVIRYLYFGTYRLSDKRKINEAKPNQNHIKYRNQLLSGIYCHTDYKDVIKDFDFYNKQKPNVKNKATEIVLAWHPNDFDFHNKEDVYEAMQFARKFAKRAFPNHMCLLAAQFDTSGKRPVPHIHILVSQFNMKNLKVLRGPQLSVKHLRYISDKLTSEYNHKSPSKIIDMKHYRGQHHRTPTPAEMSVLTPLSHVLSQLPTSQNNMRKLARTWAKSHHDGFRISFKRAGRRSRNRRRQRGRGRRRRWRGMLMKSNNSHGWIPVSKERYFDNWCPGISKLHNNPARRTLYKLNWGKIQANRTAEIKEISRRMDNSAIFNLLHGGRGQEAGEILSLDDFKLDVANYADVIVTTPLYKSRKTGQWKRTIRYKLKGHRHSYSGYQFIKMYGQAGRKFNNFDIQRQLNINKRADDRHWASLNNGFSDTFNSIDTTGREDMDTQLSVTPPVQPTTQPKPDNEPEPSPATSTTSDTARKRKAIHAYYQTKQSDRDKIDRFLAKLDRFAHRQARAVAVEMRKLRKRSSAWLRKNAIRPLEYKAIQAMNRDRITAKAIKKDPLGSAKKLDKSLSPHGQGYLRSTMLMLNSNSTATFKNGLIRQDRRRNGKSYTPFGKLTTSEKTFAHSLHDSSQGLSRREISRINEFLESDTIISQLKDNHLYKRFTTLERTTPAKSTTKKQRTPVKSHAVQRDSDKRNRLNDKINAEARRKNNKKLDKSVKRSKEKSKNYERD